MSGLLAENRRAVQPSGFARIDWGNPITSGLRSVVNANDPSWNPATDVRNTVNGVVPAFSHRGFAVASAGTTPPITTPEVISGDSTVLLLVVPRTAGGTNVYFTASAASAVRWIGQSSTAWSISGSVNAPGNSVALDKQQCVVVTHAGATHAIYIDGVLAASGTPSLTDGSDGASWLGFGTTGGFDVGAADGGMLLGLLWNRALSDSEIVEISENPWQIFRETGEDYLVPAGAAGTTIDGTLGTATASGFQASVSATTAINAALGTATASGFQATVSVGTSSAAVTDTTLYFSPYNWYSDGAGSLQSNNVKGSSTYAQSNNPGAYFKFKVTTTTTGDVVANFDNAHLSTVTGADYPQLAIFRDGGAPTLTQLSGTTTQAVTLASGLAAGTYEFVVLFKACNVTGADRWNTPRLSVKCTGLTVPAGSSFSAPTKRSRNIIIYGDSITEGVANKGTTTAVADQDAGYTWGQFLAAALDAEVGIVGFGQSGWQTAGAGNVAQFQAGWDLYSAGRSRLVSGSLTPAPDSVVICHGVNDSATGLTAVIDSVLTAIRAACSCRIYVLIPFDGSNRSAINAATLPANTYRFDVNSADLDGSHLRYYPGFNGPLHPSIEGSAFLAPRLAKLIDRGQVKTSRTATITLVDTGGSPRASLTGLSWAWWDGKTPDLQTAPTDQGTGETTDGSGVLSISVRTALAASGVGWLVVTNSDGTTTQSPAHRAFSGPVAVT